MMPTKTVRRRVMVLDTSNQLSLFDEEIVEALPKASNTATERAVKFHAPDPRDILINQIRLEDHLKAVGLTTPLKMRVVLERLSFAEFEKHYQPGGRPPYAPQAMLSVILYGIVQGISSLRDLERMARSDLGCWWLSGGIMPDHSVIGRFVQQHGALLTESFFEQLTRQVLKATGSGTGTVAGDGTVIEAMSSRFKLIREEALNEALETALQKAQEQADQAQAKLRLEQLKQAKQQLTERQSTQAAKGKDPAKTQVQQNEPEAVVQPQKNSKDFSSAYKPSVLANDKRVIVACTVHPSSETAVVPELLDRAQALGQVDTALFDSGYFSEGILRATEERSIELLCPEGQSLGDDWNKQSDKQFPKSRFDYLPEEDVYVCPNQQRLTRSGHYRGNAANPAYTEYATDACPNCPLKSKCTRSETGRKIKRYAIDTEKDALRTKMAQSEHRQRYRSRQAMVEPVFSQLRGRQGLQRFRRNGLSAVRVEFALHAMAYNLGRAVVLVAFTSLFGHLWHRLMDYYRASMAFLSLLPHALII
jgi:transposase